VANNYLQFSFVIKELTPELSGALEGGLRLAQDTSEDAEGWSDCNIDGVNWAFISKEGEELWVYCEENGGLEGIAHVIQNALAKVGSHRAIGFTWAETCSKMREGEFTGGGVFITKDEIKWFIPGQMILDEVNKRREEPKEQDMKKHKN